MGLFDSVYVDCPHCGKPVEFQTKADIAPYMRRYTLDDAPDYMLHDIINSPEHCGACDQWMVLVDPKFPPGEPPRPNIQVAKCRTPENPDTHFQGMKWWPRDKDFSYADLVDEKALTSTKL